MSYQRPMPTLSGADEHAPSFLEYVERMRQIEADLDRELAAVRLGTIRRECERANRAEKREASMRKALWAAATLAAFETLLLLWVVLR